MHRLALPAALASLLFACGGDAGDDWSPASGAPALLAVSDVWAFSPTDVWFLDGTNTVHRHDGQSWTTLDTPSTSGLGCIYALSATEVWLCAGEEVLRWDGADFTASDVSGPTGLDGLTGLWVAPAGDAFAIGDDAIVARWDGAAWTGSLSGATFAASIWGASPSNVYVLGTFDLVHFDGAAWTAVELGPGGGGGDGQVWGTSASDVWVLSGSSELYHFDGAAWQTVDLFDSDFVGDPAVVWGATPDDLWAAGSAGSIAHWDGASWNEVTHQEIGAPYLRQFLAIHGSSATDIWAVGQQLGQSGSTGIIYHYQP
jgi:hypothetical protein